MMGKKMRGLLILLASTASLLAIGSGRARAAIVVDFVQEESVGHPGVAGPSIVWSIFPDNLIFKIFKKNRDNVNSIGFDDTFDPWASFFLTTNFSSLNPVDSVFRVENSQGTTEYFFEVAAFNRSAQIGSAQIWSDFHFDLGFGTSDNFVSSGDDGLDFDTPHKDAVPTSKNALLTSDIFSISNHMDDSIWWSGGGEIIPIAIFSPPTKPTVGVFTFSLDTADLNDNIPAFARTDNGYKFTLRATPSIESAVIPEPSTMALFSLGLLGITLRQRYPLLRKK